MISFEVIRERSMILTHHSTKTIRQDSE